MNESKIAVRYAKAFFEWAQEKNQLDVLRGDIDKIALTCSQADVQLMLESPVVKTSNKKKLLSHIFAENIEEISLKFLLLITQQKREMHIKAICRNFIAQYRAHKGIKAAVVTTALAVDEASREHIKRVISEVFKSDVELSTTENSELIGGFILRVGDQQIDASVSTKLKRIKREFLDKKI